MLQTVSFRRFLQLLGLYVLKTENVNNIPIIEPSSPKQKWMTIWISCPKTNFSVVLFWVVFAIQTN